ncbi:MAG: hypothetical protein ACTSRG_00150 [Candidatus Helarchaeota archaeon]
MSDWDNFDFFKEEKKTIKTEKPKKKVKKEKDKEKTKIILKKQVYKKMPIKTYTNKMTSEKEIPYIEEIKIKKPEDFTNDDIKLIRKSLTQDRLWDIKKILFMQLPLPNVTLSTERHKKRELLPLFQRIFSDMELDE